jgi:uncharacterized protein (DUF305 family)
MKQKKSLTLLLLGSAATLFSVGLAACTNATTPASNSQDSNSQISSPQSVAQSPPQSPMSGMDHGSMDHSMGSMSMELGPKDEAFDLRFIDAMIPHHQGAVVMAQEALQKSNRPEIKQLAEEIIAAQEQEIAQMQEWRTTWYADADDTPMMYDASMGHMMPMTPEMRESMMMSGDLGAADDQFDLRFINMMIPHHQGAVEMANQALEKTDRPELKTLAQEIVSSQQQEIDEMTQWRKEWYGQ